MDQTENLALECASSASQMFKLLVQIHELSGEATDDIITVGAHFQKSVREVRELSNIHSCAPALGLSLDLDPGTAATRFAGR